MRDVTEVRDVTSVPLPSEEGTADKTFVLKMALDWLISY